MMKTWTKILPLIFIEWYAKKNLEKLSLHTKVKMVRPFKGIYIKAE